jgi:predicted nicotinamide N-methyase
VDETNSSNLNVYPNPASDVLTIASSNDGATRVTITDMAGRTVQATTLNSARRTQLDVSMLPAGTYVVTIENNTELLRRAVQLVK